MGFTPQSIDWPGDRALLLVHGIGDGSGGGAFPLAAVQAALGPAAAATAIYTLPYDFLNDWAARKLGLAAGIAALGAAIAARYDVAALSDTLAEYGGDVLWPILHHETRLAIRDAYVAQLQQIVIDCGEAALARGDDPLDYKVGIVAHSLGCFHTYEVLHACVRTPAYRLRPGTDLTVLDSVVLMASPVQLIRTVAGALGPLVPARDELATLAPAGLSIPAEPVGRTRVAATRRLLSVTGSEDPVGGHLLGRKQDWAYMAIDGQESTVLRQQLVGADPVAALRAALTRGDVLDAGLSVTDPHSWEAYVTRSAPLLRGLFA